MTLLLAGAKRNNGLDTLRVAAILLVFAYHYMVFVSGEPTFGWVSTAGWAGVDLFFVLSGYLIGNQLFAGISRGQTLSLKAFYARRFVRTLPNYYAVLALYFLLPTLMGGNAPPPLWRFLSFTQNLWLQPGTAFSHAWSLCIEEQFYLLLPLFIVGALRIGKRFSVRAAWLVLAGFIVVGIATRSVLWLRFGQDATGDVPGYYPNIYYSSFCRFDEFLPGVAIAMLRNFHPQTWERITRWGAATFTAGLIAVAASFYAILEYYYVDGVGYGFFMTAFGYSLVACAFGLLVVAALSPASLLFRLRIPGAGFLAAWSYAIYLSHKPIAFILQKQLSLAGLNPTAMVLPIAAACLLGGWLLHRVVETPFMRWRDRRWPTSFPSDRTSTVGGKPGAAQYPTA
jgi:peptidoglycan/LPS O-acetylase OafA/YrhL